MAKKFDLNLAKFFFCFVINLFLIFFFGFAKAQTNYTNDDIVNRIEKNLLFDKQSKEAIDFYNPTTDNKKSDFVINKIEKSDKKTTEPAKNENVEILVVDQKKDAFDLREKEKMAYNYSLISQYEVSIYLLKSILEKEPNNNYANFSLASIYQKIGQNRQAKAIYYKMLQQDNDNQEEIIANLLSIMTDESPKESITTISRLIIQNPQKDFLYSSAGSAYEKLGDYGQALKMFEQAYKINNGNLKHIYNLAVINDKLKNYQAAYELYTDVLEKYTDENQDISADRVKYRIEQIKKII